jgi:serine/threonine-protein kinase RsbT
MANRPLRSLELPIAVRNIALGGDVSMNIKTLLMRSGVPHKVIRKAAIACYEAEMNVVMHADRGTLRVDIFPDRLEFVVADRGPGIGDIELAMTEGYSTASEEAKALGFGAGMGLPNVLRNSNSMELKSVVGVGTTLRFTIAIDREKKEEV